MGCIGPWDSKIVGSELAVFRLADEERWLRGLVKEEMEYVGFGGGFRECGSLVRVLLGRIRGSP